MKFLYFTFALVFSVLATQAQTKDAIVGVWQNPTGEARIQIYKQADSFFGKIIWLKEPTKDGEPKTDSNNPDPSLTSQPIMGLQLLRNFKYKGNNLWEDGTIYDPKSGNTYSCKITAVGNDKIDIRGYIGISLLGRSETWVRVK